MPEKSKRRRASLARRYVRSVLALMLLMIVVLGLAAAHIVRYALMLYTSEVAFIISDSLAINFFKAFNEYVETGTITAETLGVAFGEALDFQKGWDSPGCFVAIPEEEGIRYLVGIGDHVTNLFLENDLEPPIMNYVEPYHDGLKEWLQGLTDNAGNVQKRQVLIFNDPDHGQVALAASPIYRAFLDDGPDAFAFVLISLNRVYGLIVRITAILIGLIVLITAAAVILFYRYIMRHTVRPIQDLSRGVLEIKDRLSEGEVYHSDIHTGDEIEDLSHSFEHMSVDMRDFIAEKSRMTAERERLSTELNMAASIQAAQLPNVFPVFPDHGEFDLCASMKPAKEVGGDFYDFFLVDDDHLALVIADVSGKGVPAALFMMTAMTIIRNQLKSGMSPAETLQSANEQLLETNKTRQFVTVWLAIIDLATGRGIAANAGHEHPALRRAGEAYGLVKYMHSLPVAAMKGSEFLNREFELHPGDSLFVYTDGVAEAANAGKKLFGTDRMLAALNREMDADPRRTLANVREDMQAFVNGADQFDDVTMLCLRYNGRSEKQEK